MQVGYTLHMPLWARIKLLFGYGLRVEYTTEGSLNLAIFTEGDRHKLAPILTLNNIPICNKR